MPLAGRLLWVASGAMFFLSGLALWGWTRRRYAAARHWLTVPGRIVSASYARSESDSAITYDPMIRYRYRVGGRELEAGRIRLLGTSKSQSEDHARKLMARYAPGTAVVVRHSPHRPTQACLEIDEPSSAAFIVMAMSLPFWAVAAVWP